MKRSVELQRELARLRRENVALRHEVETDALTRVGNRRALDARLDEAAAVIVFDVDHFKSVNDEHGHHVGDDVLREVAHVLRTNVREQDRVYRAGGEEFTVLCAGSGSVELAERLREAVASHVVESLGRAVTISGGVATTQDGGGARDAWKRADVAMYAAKRDGRNRVRVAA